MNNNTNSPNSFKRNIELKVPPVVLTILFGCVMFNASLFLPKMALNNVISISATAVILLISLMFCLFGVLEFRKNQTTVDPRFPEKTSSLVNSGIYSISRNPMYVGFVLILVSLIFLLQSPLLIVAVIGFVIYMNVFQIEPEERFLLEHFADAFTEYKTKVRRWI